jgi:hypothetical protein
MTDKQNAAFVNAVNEVIASVGLAPGDAAALLGGAFAEAAEKAWGAERAAHESYLLALRLARKAGVPLKTAIH